MTTTTPDMNLILPDVLSTVGPTWATELNAALTLIDSHDHSSGKGIAITPSGLNISSDLTFAQNNATNLRTLRLYNNSAFSAGINDKTCLYSLNGELYYIDAAGNNVQITAGGILDVSVSLTSLTLKDSVFALEYFGDITKIFRFDGSLLTTATTNLFSVPNIGSSATNTGTLTEIAAPQTISNKNLGPTNTLTGSRIASFTPDGSHTLTAPLVTDTIAGLTATQTFTDKTLINPIISSLSPDGTHTTSFQPVTDTVVYRTTTDPLTNKILTGNTIASFTPNGGTNTLTAPAITDTLVTRTNTEILSNKSVIGPLIMLADTSIQFNNSANTFSTSLKAGANTANTTFVLPIADGSSTQVIQTDGSGNLSFATVPTTTGNVAANDSNVVFTNASNRVQICNPTAPRTYTMPTTAISAGDQWAFYNQATSWANYITLQSSGSNTIIIVPPQGIVRLASAVATPTTAANWIVLERVSQLVVYQPTYSAGCGTATNNTTYAKIIGDTLFMTGSFSTGTPAASLASFTIPPAVTIASGKTSLSNTTGSAGNILGNFSQNQNNAFGYIVSATGTSATSVYFGLLPSAAGAATLTPQNGSAIFNPSSTTVFDFKVSCS